MVGTRADWPTGEKRHKHFTQGGRGGGYSIKISIWGSVNDMGTVFNNTHSVIEL